MLKALGSRVHLNIDDREVASRYRDCVKDLIDTDEVISLMDYEHHVDVNRFDHCLNVSYLSFVLCRSLRMDARAAARGGLLHDLFFYNVSEQDISMKDHFFCHARNALENARRLCDLTKTEEDIILNHMWPSTHALPKTREGQLVCLIDKYCSVGETAQFVVRATRRSLSRAKGSFVRAFLYNGLRLL